MVTPFNLPLTVTKGVHFGPITFLFKNPDTTPFDLTEWSAFAYARRTHDARDKIDLEPAITNAVGGTVQLPEWDDEKTMSLMAGEYSWDMILEAPTGVRIGPYFAGSYKIREINTHI